MDHLTNTKTQIVLMQIGQVPLLHTITAPVLEYVQSTICTVYKNSVFLYREATQITFTVKSTKLSLPIEQ